jgi:hypothetical protein
MARHKFSYKEYSEQLEKTVEGLRAKNRVLKKEVEVLTGYLTGEPRMVYNVNYCKRTDKDHYWTKTFYTLEEAQKEFTRYNAEHKHEAYDCAESITEAAVFYQENLNVASDQSQHKEPPAAAPELTGTVYRVHCVARERGEFPEEWHKDFTTEKEARAYKKEINNKNTSLTAPDYYEQADRIEKVEL